MILLHKSDLRAMLQLSAMRALVKRLPQPLRRRYRRWLNKIVIT